MANYTIKKRVLMRGEKGDTGDTGIDSTIPLGGLIAIKDEIEMPAGYELYEYVEDGTLIGITATYNQTATITDRSSLDDLRPDLTVISEYDNGHTYVISDYTLSGTLEVGTSTITASYNGFSDSFDVTVEESIHYLYNWDFTESLTDKVQGLTAVLYGSAITWTQGVGIVSTTQSNRIYLGDTMQNGYTAEIDFTTFRTDTGGAARWLLATDNFGPGWGINSNANPYWQIYRNGYRSFSTPENHDASVFNNKTAKFIFNNDNDIEIYADDTLIYKGINLITGTNAHQFYLGENSGRSITEMTITGARIYANQ